MVSVRNIVIFCLSLGYVYCYDDDEQLEIIQRISSYVGLVILVFVVVYICGCITVVLYCAWKGRCGMDGEEDIEETMGSAVDIRPPNYNEIFKGKQQKSSSDSLPAYDAVVMGNFSFPVNSRSSRRSSISSNNRRNSLITEV